MNIELPRAELVPVLATVANVVERRHTLPILGNLLLVVSGDRALMRATDLELEIGTVMSATAQEGGDVTVPARKFMDICRSLPEEAQVRLKVDGERAVVSSGRSRFVLSTLPAQDFPAMEFGDAALTLELGAAQLKRLLEKTAFAMAQQDVRYYLNGVMLELSASELVAVATDGHRMAMAREDVVTGLAEGEEARQLIIPAKTVNELKRLLPVGDARVRLEVSERSVRARFDDVVVTSKLVDGRYPEYRRVIPEDLPRRALLEREALRGALQRAAILSNEKYKGVRVTFSNGTLGLQAHNPEKEQADDAIEMGYDGDEVVIGFNIAYILDVLQAIDVDQVEVLFRDADSSAIWRGEGNEDETFVIMPMRL